MIDLNRLRAAGFTEAQAQAIADTVTQATHGLVTRDYLDLRLREEFAKHKRSMLLWMLAMQAPVYAALIYILLRLGA